MRSTKTIFSEAYADRSSLISYISKHKGSSQCYSCKLKDNVILGEEAGNDTGRKEGLGIHRKKKAVP